MLVGNPALPGSLLPVQLAPPVEEYISNPDPVIVQSSMPEVHEIDVTIPIPPGRDGPCFQVAPPSVDMRVTGSWVERRRGEVVSLRWRNCAKAGAFDKNVGITLSSGDPALRQVTEVWVVALPDSGASQLTLSRSSVEIFGIEARFHDAPPFKE